MVVVHYFMIIYYLFPHLFVSESKQQLEGALPDLKDDTAYVSHMDSTMQHARRGGVCLFMMKYPFLIKLHIAPSTL